MSYPNQSQPNVPGRPGGQDPNRQPPGPEPSGLPVSDEATPDSSGSYTADTGQFSPGPGRSAADPLIVDEGVYRPGASEDTDAGDEAKRVASDAAGRTRDVAGTAKEEATALADTAKVEGGQVLGTAKEEAGHVIDEAKHQTRRIVDDGVGELKQQAEVGQHRVAEVVRSLTNELSSMTGATTESGPVVEFAGRVQRLGDDAADWLERSRPEEVLDSVRRFAARRPWTFLAISAGVGFAAARLVRGLSDGGEEPGSSSSGSQRHFQAPSYSDDERRLGHGPQHDLTSPERDPLGGDLR